MKTNCAGSACWRGKTEGSGPLDHLRGILHRRRHRQGHYRYRGELRLFRSRFRHLQQCGEARPAGGERSHVGGARRGQRRGGARDGDRGAACGAGRSGALGKRHRRPGRRQRGKSRSAPCGSASQAAMAGGCRARCNSRAIAMRCGCRRRFSRCKPPSTNFCKLGLILYDHTV